MPLPTAVLDRFNAEQNVQLRWLMGKLLLRRGNRDDWFNCPVFQLLAAGDNYTRRLNEFIERFRGILIDEREAHTKAQEMLNPDVQEFDNKFEDFLSEIIAAIHLSEQGCSRFHFCEPPQPDFVAERRDRQVFAEVKHLRKPASLFEVAFSQWEANRTRDAARYQFDYIFSGGGENLALAPDQENALRQLIDRLPERARPAEFTHTLPRGANIKFRLMDGEGVMQSDAVGGNLADIRSRFEQDILCKFFYGSLGKALSQLYSSHVPADAERVIVLRWTAPDDAALVENEIRQEIPAALRDFLVRYFPNLEICMV